MSLCAQISLSDSILLCYVRESSRLSSCYNILEIRASIEHLTDLHCAYYPLGESSSNGAPRKTQSQQLVCRRLVALLQRQQRSQLASSTGPSNKLRQFIHPQLCLCPDCQPCEHLPTQVSPLCSFLNDSASRQLKITSTREPRRRDLSWLRSPTSPGDDKTIKAQTLLFFTWPTS